jgi:hypothetical protein
MTSHKFSLCMILGVLLENKRGKVHLILNTSGRGASPTFGVEVMNTVSTPLSQAVSQVSWWSRIANPVKPDGEIEEQSYIDAEDFSDHMLRDIGLRDGRPMRGERPEPNDLNSLFRDYTKRFL